MKSTSFWVGFRHTALLAAAWSVLAFLVLPMLIIVPVSLTDTPYISLPQEQLSLQHYESFFTGGTWLSAIFQSFVIAAGSTILALLLGSMCAIGCWRLSNNVSDMVRLLMLAPMIIPPVVQGLAYFRLWAAIGIYDTYLGMIIAHGIAGLPFVMVTVSASLANFDLRLEQAARSLGASTSQAVRYVIVPNITPGLLSGGLFAFAHSFDELVIALFITSRHIYTLPKRIWDGIQESVNPTIAAAAVVLVCITLALLLANYLIGQLKVRKAAPKNDEAPTGIGDAAEPQRA